MAKLTRKSYKRKKVAFAAVILGGVALVSSGFAAWVLSGSASQNNSGVVTVGIVQNDTLKMKVYKTDSSKAKTGDPLANEADTGDYFNFDADAKDAKDTMTNGETRADRIYWGSREAENPEKLDNTYVIEVTSKTNSLASLQVEMSVDKSFAKVTAAKFVNMPSCYISSESSSGVLLSSTDGEKFDANITQLSGDSYSVTRTGNDENGYTWSFTYTIGFTWGDRFNGKNPCYFFDTNNTSKGSGNPRGMTSTNVDDDTIGDGYGTLNAADIDNDIIEADLNWLSSKIGGAKYTLKFTATGK